MSDSIFIKKFATLTTNVIPFEDLNKSWKGDKRYPESAIQHFIRLNVKSFEYLGIEANGIFYKGKYSLEIKTSNYIGCVPIHSPSNGKCYATLMVTGRFNEDLTELLSVIEDTILPEYNGELELNSNEMVKPPLYLECANYIDKYIEARKYNWRKFSNTIKEQQFPTASTLWSEYAINSINPEKVLIYKNKCNTLSTNHTEWKQLTYVLSIAINELESLRTPNRSRMAYVEKIIKLKNTYDLSVLLKVDHIHVRMSDPIVIKELKYLANDILNETSNKKVAWRIDIAVLFERYVQFLLNSISKNKGANLFNNPHYTISGPQRPEWCLHYIEPDAIMQRNEIQYIVDAKYKSHMYNVGDNSNVLKEDFRRDLHQVLAYSSLSANQNKNVVLFYPASKIMIKELSVNSSLTNFNNNIYLVGIPLEKVYINSIIKEIASIINFDKA